jgi:hypothetical protein
VGETTISTLDGRFRKFPVAGRRSRRQTKQSILLVKAHGFRIDLGALRELPSCETFYGFSVNPVGVYRVKGIRDSAFHIPWFDLVAGSGHRLIEEPPTETVALIRGFLDASSLCGI